MSNSNKIPSSFRDPSGFVFRFDGEIYRRINKCYQKEFELLMESGLYKELSEANLMISHQDLGIEIKGLENCDKELFKYIKPEQLQFISYPYEWSFSQLKDAALLTLKIQKLAIQSNMSLKDASAYNIQFKEGKPVFIDSLSFEEYKEGKPWVAYKQFCQHFLAPLALMAYKDLRISDLMQSNLDGIDLELAASLLPKKTVLNPSLLMHIHMHASSMKKHSKGVDTETAQKGKVTRMGLLGIVDNLESAIKGLSLGQKETFWQDYYSEHNYSDQAFAQKKEFVESKIEELGPEKVLDLGANTGVFSRLASDRGIFTVSSDFDPLTIEASYLKSRAEAEKNILPLKVNLMAPSPAIGWGNTERQSFSNRCDFDLILALALIHHLAVTNNVPLPYIAEYFRSLGRYLVIEFVPKQDSQVIEMLSLREDIFYDYDEAGFEAAFSEFYTISDKQKILESERTIYLLKGK